jgi:hypothetical protein
MRWQVGQVLYRAKAGGSWGWDHEYRVWVDYDEYEVLRVTPEGGWLRRVNRPHSKETWRSFSTQFARMTQHAALHDLRLRTRRYVQHCRRRLEEAEARLKEVGGEEPKPRFTELRSR